MEQAGMSAGVLRVGRAALLTGALLLALNGCASTPAPAADAPVVARPQPAAPTAPAVVATPQTPAQQCDAAELAYLVGRPRSEIPVPLNPALRRVACLTCPVTLDYNPRRTNIFFDADTGVIREVKCG